MATTLHTSDLALPLLHRGKVRDVYELPGDRLLMVASDRLSAFDVVLPDPIPGKGEMLCQISNFWFAQTAHLCPNHLTHEPVESVLPAGADPDLYSKRSVVAKKLRALPVEAIARGYIIGSGWKDYQSTGAICGIPLPAGLKMAARLPAPIFTPATKAEVGDHDENVSFEQAAANCNSVLAEALAGTGKTGAQLCAEARDAAIRLYEEASAYAATRGIIIADTKFEFGIDAAGTLHLIDEALTQDSSRFWPADQYVEGQNPPSYDKQYVRDYLETLDWGKVAPGPKLPADVIARTSAKYIEAYERLTGKTL